MKQTYFVIDAFENDIFEGFTDDRKWNGWACPYFTFEQAKKVVEVHKRATSNAWYDEKSDTFNFQMDKEDKDDIESYEPIKMEGQKFYPVGNSQWVWEEKKMTNDSIKPA